MTSKRKQKRKRVPHLSKSEKIQLAVVVGLMVLIVLVAMVVGGKLSSHF